MNIRDLINKLDKVSSDIQKLSTNIVNSNTVSALSDRKQQIQQQGLDGEVYSESYSSSRRFKKKLKDKNKVNLTFRGRMMNNIFVDTDGGSGVVTSSASATSESNLFSINNERYPDFIQLKEKNLNQLQKDIVEDIRDIITKNIT